MWCNSYWVLLCPICGYGTHYFQIQFVQLWGWWAVIALSMSYFIVITLFCVNCISCVPNNNTLLVHIVSLGFALRNWLHVHSVVISQWHSEIFTHFKEDNIWKTKKKKKTYVTKRLNQNDYDFVVFFRYVFETGSLVVFSILNGMKWENYEKFDHTKTVAYKSKWNHAIDHRWGQCWCALLFSRSLARLFVVIGLKKQASAKKASAPDGNIEHKCRML